ncbi:MAG: hypothetical protein D6713_09160 [Deltaproteobacteria bacterium]|nr:MAG: hypothetical protein D6713_09160 [Deltaproteobacteria bacterium]
MVKKANKERTQRGSALVMALIIMVVLTLAGIMAVNYSSTGVVLTSSLRSEIDVFQAADSGIEEAKSLLLAQYPWNDDLVNTVLVDNASLGDYNYTVTVTAVAPPDYVTIQSVASGPGGESKVIEAVVHYRGGIPNNRDQEGQGAETTNVVN